MIWLTMTANVFFLSPRLFFKLHSASHSHKQLRNLRHYDFWMIVDFAIKKSNSN